MKILMERFPDYGVTVDTDAYLFKHCIDISIVFLLSSFSHHDHTSSSLFYVLLDVMKFLSIEREAWTTQ
jgi:hypothetical protein